MTSEPDSPLRDLTGRPAAVSSARLAPFPPKRMNDSRAVTVSPGAGSRATIAK